MSFRDQSPSSSSVPSPGVAGSEQNSNSSWAEMEPQIIGHFPIHPLSRQARQIFALKLLTPLAEYQEVRSTRSTGLFVPYDVPTIEMCTMSVMSFFLFSS